MISYRKRRNIKRRCSHKNRLDLLFGIKLIALAADRIGNAIVAFSAKGQKI
jgi:hypothetical protein